MWRLQDEEGYRGLELNMGMRTANVMQDSKWIMIRLTIAC
jgi:hypothetical protein